MQDRSRPCHLEEELTFPDVDDVCIHYQPDLPEKQLGEVHRHLILRFHTPKGWVCVRLEGQLCEEFRKRVQMRVG